MLINLEGRSQCLRETIAEALRPHRFRPTGRVSPHMAQTTWRFVVVLNLNEVEDQESIAAHIAGMQRVMHKAKPGYDYLLNSMSRTYADPRSFVNRRSHPVGADQEARLEGTYPAGRENDHHQPGGEHAAPSIEPRLNLRLVLEAIWLGPIRKRDLKAPARRDVKTTTTNREANMQRHRMNLRLVLGAIRLGPIRKRDLKAPARRDVKTTTTNREANMQRHRMNLRLVLGDIRLGPIRKRDLKAPARRDVKTTTTNREANMQRHRMNLRLVLGAIRLGPIRKRDLKAPARRDVKTTTTNREANMQRHRMNLRLVLGSTRSNRRFALLMQRRGVSQADLI
ncbi:hypothetical protein MTO96_025243 [Rhipicephalus appendiculatus]